MPARKPYSGSARKLVVALDVGTTYSGVSYSVLEPGEISEILPVTRFPAQEYAGTDSKIPTLIYYDVRGVARAFGAEVLEGETQRKAQDEKWFLAEWFKLHLRPKALSSSHVRDDDIPPLPLNKTIIDVFADFLRYLFKCTREYIQESHPEESGVAFWKSVENEIDFVLSHPNGWEGAQQSQMRRAAVRAGLVSDSPDSQARIQFVTEGEASLHFCVENKTSAASLTSGQGVIVVDAGGGTIDLSAYLVQDLLRNSFEELCPTECRLQGSIFVSRRARTLLENKLRGSRYGSAEEIKCITAEFDKTAKITFRDKSQTSYVKFGSLRDNDNSVGIRQGTLKLAGEEVALLFEPSIKATIDAIKQQIQVSQRPITNVFLVGGFAASNYLFSQLQTSLQLLGLNIFRPDRHQNKAVSEGAVSFYLNHLVSVRVAKWTYGTKVVVDLNENNPEHQRRIDTVVTTSAGEKVVPNHWSPILRKVSKSCLLSGLLGTSIQGTRVSETKEFRQSYVRVAYGKSVFYSLEDEIHCYRGDLFPGPEWMDVEPGNFPVICKVVGDTEKIADSLTPRRGSQGTYYRLEYDVVLLFGLTELRAQLSWREDGEEKRSRATLVYDELN